MDEYLTVQQAATELGLSRRGVQERIERGELRAERAGARLWLIPRVEIDRHRALGRLKSGPKPGRARERRNKESPT